MQCLRNLFRNSKGATAIEYGLITALIGVAAIGAMASFGGKHKDTSAIVSSAVTLS